MLGALGSYKVLLVMKMKESSSWWQPLNPMVDKEMMRLYFEAEYCDDLEIIKHFHFTAEHLLHKLHNTQLSTIIIMIKLGRFFCLMEANGSR